jgi:serine/threonine protein kinase
MKAIGNFIIEKNLLGRGQYGEVYRAHDKKDHNKLYACKIIKNSKLTTLLFTYLKNEIALLAKIDS